MKLIGIVCPVYGEEDVISRFYERLVSTIALLGAQYRFRILYVLDPSPDGTEEILKAICEKDDRVGVIVLSRRFGHQAALIAGMDHCDADALITIDSDLQHPPEIIPELLERFEKGVDVVQTVRRDVANRSAFERLTSGWFYLVMRKLSTVDLQSGTADYRLLSRRVVEVFRTSIREQNQFVRGMVRWVGFRTEMVPFDCGPRAGGESKYGLLRLLAFAVHGICSFSKVPLRMAMLFGAFLAIFGFIYGVFVIATYFVGPRIVPGWTSLLALVAFLGGFQLIFLGVIGEYIGLIFDEVKDRPLYLIDRAHGRVEGSRTAGRSTSA